MDKLWFAYLLDKLILLAILIWGGLAIVLGWIVPMRHVPVDKGLTPSLMPTPPLALDDLLLLVGVKEAQLAVLQRQLTTLQAQVATERDDTKERSDA